MVVCCRQAHRDPCVVSVDVERVRQSAYVVPAITRKDACCHQSIYSNSNYGPTHSKCRDRSLKFLALFENPVITEHCTSVSHHFHTLQVVKPFHDGFHIGFPS